MMRFFICCVFLWFATYLACGFTQWSLHAGEWDELVRANLVVAWVICTAVSAFVSLGGEK